MTNDTLFVAHDVNLTLSTSSIATFFSFLLVFLIVSVLLGVIE